MVYRAVRKASKEAAISYHNTEFRGIQRKCYQRFHFNAEVTGAFIHNNYMRRKQETSFRTELNHFSIFIVTIVNEFR